MPAFTVATILSTTCWPEARRTKARGKGEKGKGKRVNHNTANGTNLLAHSKNPFACAKKPPLVMVGEVLTLSPLPFTLFPIGPFPFPFTFFPFSPFRILRTFA